MSEDKPEYSPERIKGVRITIEGPVSTGKSLIAARLMQILRDEFGASVIGYYDNGSKCMTYPDVETEKQLMGKRMANNVYVIDEICTKPVEVPEPR